MGRRADVHPGPQADRLEALENGDVFSGVAASVKKKSPANLAISGRCSVPDRAAVRRASRGSSRPLSQRFCEGFHPRSRRRAQRPARAPPLSVARDRGGPCVVRRRGSGSAPGRSADAGAASSERRPRAARGASARAGRARRPRRRAVATWSVPSRARRAGQALRAICSPIASGQRAHDLASSPPRGRSARARAGRPRRFAPASRRDPRQPRLDLDQLVRLEGKSRRAGRRDQRLAAAAQPRGEGAAPALSSSESTSSSKRSGGAGPRSVSSSASASRSESTARRCSPCEP